MLLEEEYWEAQIRALATDDPVLGSPVTIPGQDYEIDGGTIQVMWVRKPNADPPTDPEPADYLIDVVVKLAGGAGAALDEGDDYTVNLRTGVITVVAMGALDGQTDAWVEATKDGPSNVAIRQLGNRTSATRAALLQALSDIEDIENTLLTLSGFVPTSRSIGTGHGLQGGGDLGADRTIDLKLQGTSLAKSTDGLKVNVIDDTMHGIRAGGDRHAAATTSVNGFMSAGDKTRLDSALRTRVRIIGVTAASHPATVGTSTSPDFSSFSLQAGDVLFVHAAGGDGADPNFTAPAGQGWTKNVDQSGNGTFEHALFSKVWGQGHADSATPVFTNASASVVTRGFVVRGLKVAGGNAVMTTAQVYYGSSSSDFIDAPDATPTVDGSLALRLYADSRPNGAVTGTQGAMPFVMLYHGVIDMTVDWLLAAAVSVTGAWPAGIGIGTARAIYDAGANQFHHGVTAIFEPL